MVESRQTTESEHDQLVRLQTRVESAALLITEWEAEATKISCVSDDEAWTLRSCAEQMRKALGLERSTR